MHCYFILLLAGQNDHCEDFKDIYKAIANGNKAVVILTPIWCGIISSIAINVWTRSAHDTVLAAVCMLQQQIAAARACRRATKAACQPLHQRAGSPGRRVWPNFQGTGTTNACSRCITHRDVRRYPFQSDWSKHNGMHPPLTLIKQFSDCNVRLIWYNWFHYIMSFWNSDSKK